MAHETRHGTTIEALARRLEPMRRLEPPGRRVAVWGAVVLALGTGLAAVADLAGLARRMAAMPEIGLMLAAAALTAAAAGLAAVLTGLPDRSPHWGWLPLPPLGLWLGAGTAAVLRGGGSGGSLAEAAGCALFVAGVALPVALVLAEGVRRGHPLRPRLTGGLVGLGAAASAETLLAFFHPHLPSPGDLALHAAVLGAIAGGGALCGRKILVAPRAGEPLEPAPAPGRGGLS
ncbi:NrsF family protein [Methylobacterium oryzisoli]|uniref:NrsF family protein n=1 Tax=Methylobacterium oryzisoli TaxID=3385502 RepID=UPI003892AFAF